MLSGCRAGSWGGCVGRDLWRGLVVMRVDCPGKTLEQRNAYGEGGEGMEWRRKEKVYLFSTSADAILALWLSWMLSLSVYAFSKFQASKQLDQYLLVLSHLKVPPRRCNPEYRFLSCISE